MNRNFARRLLLVLISPVLAGAAEKNEIQWKKITLSDQFYAEGANFGDFNHDGKMDVVSGPYWYEGLDFKVKHEFYPAQAFSPEAYSKNFLCFVQDFNGDGWDDILVIGFPGLDSGWYENPKSAEGTWIRHKVLDHVDTESPTFGDLLGVGKPVLVCGTGGHLGYARPNDADPTQPWQFHAITAKGNYQRFTHGIGLGDVNGDGKNDLLEAHGWWEQPASLEGDPVWTFHKADFGTGGAQMFAYDVNGDGKNDVITSLNAHGFGLAWFEQKRDDKGEITFEKHLIMGQKPEENAQGVHFSQLHALALIDVNGDGLKDIITGKRYFAHGSKGDPEPLAPPLLYWFELVRKDGKAEFVAHQIDDNSGVGTQVVTGDLTASGKPAVIVGNKKGTFVFIQQGAEQATK